MIDSSQPYGPGRDPLVLGEALPDVLKGMRAAELTAAKAALSAMLDPEKEGIG